PGLFAVTKAGLETFTEDGKRELLVEVPQCVYDSNQRTASSPGALRVEAVDGQFSIEGEGFLWQQTNSTLVISNQVHSVIQPTLLTASAAFGPTQNPASGGSPVQVFSDQFDYSGESGQSSYRNNVRATSTNLLLTCGVLAVQLPVGERQLQD